MDYTHLDALLLEAIERETHCSFNSLRKQFEPEFNKHVKPDRFGEPNGWRAIDRRLQAMRRAGLIRAERLGWVVVSKGIS